MCQLAYPIAFLLLTLATSSLCLNPSSLMPNKSKCPIVEPVGNFNMTALATGEWYELARYPNIIEIIPRCVVIKYRSYDDKFDTVLLNVPPNSKYSVTADIKFLENDHTGSFNFSFKYGIPQLSFDAPIYVLAIDYDRYVIWYSCDYDKITGLAKEHAWIFSRNTQLEGKDKDEVDRILKSFEAIDPEKLFWVDHTEELCGKETFLDYLQNS